MQGQRCQPSAVPGRRTWAAATLFLCVLIKSSLTFGLGTNPSPLLEFPHIGSNKPHKFPVSWSLPSGRTPGDSGISRCCSGEEPPMTEEMKKSTCAAHKTECSGTRETCQEIREEIELGLIWKKRNPHQRNHVCGSTVRSVNCPDFYLYFRFTPLTFLIIGS